MAEAAGALSCASPDAEGAALRRAGHPHGDRRPGRRPRLPRRRGAHQRPGRARRPPRARPCPRRRHRQDPPRPAVERLLREGARRPVLALLRPRSLRRPVRARGDRLPGRLRALDRAAQPRLLPRPARSGLPGGRLARVRHAPHRRGRRGVRASCAPGRCGASGFLFEYPRRGGTRARSPGAARRTAARRSRPRRAGAPRPATPRSGSASSGPAATRRRCCCRTSPSTPASRCGTVATTRSLSAVNAQRTFGFESVTTDADDVLADPTIDAVFVVTRHHSHAGFVCRALEHGKAVFVEKPLALTRAEVDGILEVVERTGNDRSWSGFNRRFAPLLVGLRAALRDEPAPRSARGTSSTPAGWPPAAGTSTSSSRGRGSSARVATSSTRSAGGSDTTRSRCSAVGTPDGSDLHATLRFADGSLATITLLDRRATRGCPKETLDVSGGGRNARLDNFTRATVWTAAGRDVEAVVHRSGQGPAGRARRLRRGGAPRRGHADRLDSLVATTRATLAVGESLAAGGPVAP